MPEYRRFIAYFYEYIEGKKEKNAGFAKVELRNGMWRILFRLTVGPQPQPPVYAYGFVREQGYLLGCLMGRLQEGSEIVEEWAYRADSPVGEGGWRMDQLAGIWIRSSDERQFVTVWDEEPIQMDRFVLNLPEAKTEESEAIENEEKVIETVIETEEIKVEETKNHSEATMDGSEVTDVESALFQDELAEELIGKRQQFQPFPKPYFTACVRLQPCDMVRMQQEDWQVGRSSFLLHGFYQYHHLMLGRTENGKYVLGVPGLHSRQEQYMAELLGYGEFRAARRCDCGKLFGYWCRELQKA